MPAPEELSEKYKEMNDRWKNEVESEETQLKENDTAARKIKNGPKGSCPEQPASP
jgi:hypothetical protein